MYYNKLHFLQKTARLCNLSSVVLQIACLTVFVSGCTSSRSFRKDINLCTVANSSVHCLAACENFNDSNRPDWCYRLFCSNGGAYYGNWCNGLNDTNTVTPAEITDYINNKLPGGRTAYENLTGGAQNDNGLSYLMALANKVNLNDHGLPMSVQMIGSSVGYVPSDSSSASSLINRDDGTDNGSINRFYIAYNGSTPYHIYEQSSTSSSGGPVAGVTGTNWSTGTPSSCADAGSCTASSLGYYYTTVATDNVSTDYYFNRSGTTYAALLLGTSTTTGVGSNGLKLFAYNTFDNVLLTENYNKTSYVAGTSDTNNLSSTGGANYLGLSNRIAVSIDASLKRLLASTVKSTDVVLLSMPSIRDGSQVGQGFDIMRSGTNGEASVSFLLNPCPVGSIACYNNSKQIDYTTYTGKWNNASFAEGVQRRYDKTTSKYVTNTNGATANYFSTGDIYQVYLSLGKYLENSDKSIVVVGAGTSGINDSGGTHSLFNKQDNSLLEGWSWYKSKNIYQTNGSVSSWYNSSECQFNGSGPTGNCLFGAQFAHGNSVMDTLQDIQTGTNGKSAKYRWVDSQNYSDMAFTSNYPVAYLYYLWGLNGIIDVNGKPVYINATRTKQCDTSIDPNCSQSNHITYEVTGTKTGSDNDAVVTTTNTTYSTSASKLVYQNVLTGDICTPGNSNSINCQLVFDNSTIISTVFYNVVNGHVDSNGTACSTASETCFPVPGASYGCDPANNNNCVKFTETYRWKDPLSQLSIDYVKDKSYNYLVAGAINGDTGHLVEYTNAAGILKYNYITVNVSDKQKYTITADTDGRYVVKTIATTSDKMTDYNNASFGNIPGTASTTTDSVTTAGTGTNYLVDKSQAAAAVLSGYISRLNDVFNTPFANVVSFYLREGATPMYGTNYLTTIGDVSIPITQSTIYVTNSFGGNSIIGKAEIDSLNRINSSGNRDLFVFVAPKNTTANAPNFSYDEMYAIKCSGDISFCNITNTSLSCSYGTDGCHPNITKGVCGQGQSCYAQDDIRISFFGANPSQLYNTSFFNYDADISNEGDKTVISIGGKSYEAYYTKYADKTGSDGSDPVDPTGNWYDPAQFVKQYNSDSSVGDATANSLYIPDLSTGIDVKFNYSGTTDRYYTMKVVSCQSGDGCDANKYYNAMKDPATNGQTYLPFTDMKVVCRGQSCSQIYRDEQFSSTVQPQSCLSNPLTCVCPTGATCYDYKYSTGGYDNVALQYFNDKSNVLILAVKNDNGQYDLQGDRFSPVVYAFDSNIKPNDLYCTDKCNNLQGQYYNPQTNSWNSLYNPAMPDGSSTSISKSCATEMKCSNDDLLFIFENNPNYFRRIPSNVFGYGNVDLQRTIDDMYYYETYYDQSANGDKGNNLAENLSKRLQMYYYNSSCMSGSDNTNCGVMLSNELGFNYNPGGTINGVNSNGTGDPDRITIPSPNSAVGFMNTLLGNNALTVSTINSFAGHSRNQDMMLSYSMGFAGPMNGYARANRIETNRNSYGGYFVASIPSVGGSFMIGSEVISTNSFHKYALTPADRNSDYMGYSLQGNDMIGSSQTMINGVRYSYQLDGKSSISMSFFGNKNEDDLTQMNPVVRNLMNSSSYMMLGSQQGMFGNPYSRYAGGYAGSMYSLTSSLSNRIHYRISSVQAYNPLLNLTSFGMSTNNALGLQSLGFGNNQGNTLTEAQVMYITEDSRSSYSISYGVLSEIGGTILGTTGLLPGSSGSFGGSSGGGVSNFLTSYADAKVIQYIGKGFYLLAHYNVGVGSVMMPSTGSELYYNFTPMLAMSWGVGIYKENIFGGAMFFTYNEPNRIVNGFSNIRAFDSSGDITSIGTINYAKLNPERHFELGYVFSRNTHSISFSGIFRMNNPYYNENAASVQSGPYIVSRHDGMFVMRFTTAI